MICHFSMYIQDKLLRETLKKMLKTRTKSKIVNEIKQGKVKFHQYSLDNFLNGKDINISTFKKLEKYVLENENN